MIATNAFVEKDLQIFASIASQAAVAIHNSNLARQIEQEAKTRAQFQRLLSPEPGRSGGEGEAATGKRRALCRRSPCCSPISVASRR